MASGFARLRRLRVLTLLAVGGALVGTLAPSTLASPFRRLDGNAIAFATDGTRYALWQFHHGTPLIVYDTRTGHRGELDEGCGLYGGSSPYQEAAAGRFLVFCGGPALLDVRTGTVTHLPSGEYGPTWSTVGTRYVAGGSARGQRCHGMRRHEGCTTLYDIATGGLSNVRDTQIPDLDRPGAPALCRRLRRTLFKMEGQVAEDFSYSNGGSGEVGDAFYDPRSRRVDIEGCHRPKLSLHLRSEPRNIELRGGVLTWDTGASSAEEEGIDTRHATLTSYSLSSRRRHTWPLPPLPINLNGGEPSEANSVGVFGYSAHTSNTLFWIADRSMSCYKLCDVATYYVYAAHL
jgi:hypothetical protein